MQKKQTGNNIMESNGIKVFKTIWNQHNTKTTCKGWILSYRDHFYFIFLIWRQELLPPSYPSMEVSAVNPLPVVVSLKRASLAFSASPATFYPNATIGRSVSMENGDPQCLSACPDQVRFAFEYLTQPLQSRHSPSFIIIDWCERLEAAYAGFPSCIRRPVVLHCEMCWRKTLQKQNH